MEGLRINRAVMSLKPYPRRIDTHIDYSNVRSTKQFKEKQKIVLSAAFVKWLTTLIRLRQRVLSLLYGPFI